MRLLGVLALASAVLGAGCPAGTSKIGSQPSWRQASGARAEFAAEARPGAPFRFAPRSEPAQIYNDTAPLPVPTSPMTEAVVDAVRAASVSAGVPTPVSDGRLFAAAAELAAVVPEEGVVAYGLVEFAMQHHGIIEPSPHLLVAWGLLDDPLSIVEQLAPRIPELLGAGSNARVGVGAARRTANGEGVVILAVQTSNVITRPIPRSLGASGRASIEGKVIGGYRDPEVFVTREDGLVAQLPSQVRGGAAGEFRAEVSCEGRNGRQQVEITAVDATGSTVLANFPLWCNQPVPRDITVSRPAGDDVVVRTEAEAEQGLLGLLNRDRQAHGLPPVVLDPAVAEVARAHSRDMRATGVVAHVSPTTGSASDRVRSAGIRTAAVLENIARAYGVGEAHAGLMNSPGHRANILSTLATHVGIGVVFGEEVSGQRELFVTQVFTRVPPPVDVARAAGEVREKVRYVRSLLEDPLLDSVAQQLAVDLAQGLDTAKAKARASNQIGARAQRYRRVGTVITAVSDLSSLSGQALIGDDATTTHVGIGVAQGSHPDIGDGALWIVLVLAEQR